MKSIRKILVRCWIRTERMVRIERDEIRRDKNRNKMARIEEIRIEMRRMPK